MSWTIASGLNTDRPNPIGNPITLLAANSSIISNAPSPSLSAVNITIDSLAADETLEVAFDTPEESISFTVTFKPVGAADTSNFEYPILDTVGGQTRQEWLEDFRDWFNSLFEIEDRYNLVGTIQGAVVTLSLISVASFTDNISLTGSPNIATSTIISGQTYEPPANLQVLLKGYEVDSSGGLKLVGEGQYLTPRHNNGTIVQLEFEVLSMFRGLFGSPQIPGVNEFGFRFFVGGIKNVAFSLATVSGEPPAKQPRQVFRGYQVMLGGYRGMRELDHFDEVIDGQTFLTHRDNFEVVRGFGAWLPVYLSFESSTQLDAEVIAYNFDESESQTISLGNFTTITQAIGSVGCGPDQLGVPDEINGQAVTHYTLELKDVAQNSVVGPRTFELIPREAQFRNMMYLNSYNCYETIILKGYAESEGESSGDIFTAGTRRMNLGTSLDGTITVSTGAVTEKDWRALRDVYLSKNVWIQAEGLWDPFVPEADEFDGRKQDDHIHVHQFTIRPEEPIAYANDEFTDTWSQSVL